MADKVKYAEMSDAEINSEVAKFKYPTSGRSTPYTHRPDVEIYHLNGTNERKDYCNSWADAGPIIESADIGLVRVADGWCATNDAATYEGIYFVHSNPLRAAMIVFLMMQEGK